MTARPGPRAARPRSEAHYGPERGDTYLIHFERRYKHAGHYTGWTDRPVLERFADHLAGQGAVLTRAVVQAGIRMKLARVWPDTTKDYEDALKHQGGARRLCPDCGAPCAPPRLATGTPRPPEERAALRDPLAGLSLYELERLGVDTETGELLPVVTTYPDQAAAAAAGEETIMFGRGRRAAEWTRQAERDQAHAEADRLAREADQIDIQAGRQPGQPLPLAADRAARVRDYIAPGLVRDTRAQASAQAPEPVLQGADLDAELGRLAGAFPEPEGLAPDAADNWAELEYDRYAEEGGGPGGWIPPEVEGPGGEPGPDAARWAGSPVRGEPAGLEAEAGVIREQAGHPEPDREPAGFAELIERQLDGRAVRAEAARRLENRALASARVAAREGDRWAADDARERARDAAATRQDATAEAYDAAAILQTDAFEADTEATAAGATLPDRTPHADPYYAARGWQAQDGIYARAPQLQAEAG